MKQLKVLILILAMIITTNSFVYAENNKFDDVNESSWYYDAVMFVYENGYFVGMNKDSFEPNSKMTRAMLSTVLFRIANKDTLKYKNIDSISFIDVTKGDWYFSYVNWASDSKFITGYEDGTFRGNNNITREETAVILGRYLKSLEVEIEQNEIVVSKFTDEDEISLWARKDVELLKEKGVVIGDVNSNFRPKEYITRAEVATIIMRLHYVIGGHINSGAGNTGEDITGGGNGNTTDNNGGGSSGNNGSGGTGGGNNGGNENFTYVPAITKNNFEHGSAFTIGADVMEQNIILAQVIKEATGKDKRQLYSVEIEVEIFDDIPVEFRLKLPNGGILVSDSNSLINNRFLVSANEKYDTTLEINAVEGAYAEIEMYYYEDDTAILVGIQTIKF